MYIILNIVFLVLGISAFVFVIYCTKKNYITNKIVGVIMAICVFCGAVFSPAENLVKLAQQDFSEKYEFEQKLESVKMTTGRIKTFFSNWIGEKNE